MAQIKSLNNNNYKVVKESKEEEHLCREIDMIA